MSENVENIKSSENQEEENKEAQKTKDSYESMETGLSLEEDPAELKRKQEEKLKTDAELLAQKSEPSDPINASLPSSSQDESGAQENVYDHADRFSSKNNSDDSNAASGGRVDKVNEFDYDGSTGEVYKLVILNFFLRIITLGIYGFWGKTRLRKYVASSFLLGNDRFEYTGTGMELFMGFLKAMGIYLALVIAFGVAVFASSSLFGESELMQVVMILPLYAIFYVLFQAAVYSALRYRLSRTRWRGIRGYMRGSAFSYAGFAFKYDLLTLFTLGILLPKAQIAKHRYIIENAYFGNVDLQFEETDKGLLKSHIITLLLVIPTLGLSRLWYQATLLRKKMGGIKADNLNMQCDIKGFDLLKHLFINLLIIVFTLGLGIPYAMQRNLRFFVAHNFVIGDLETSKILQAKFQKGGVGEGMDDVLGLDTGLM